MSIRNNRRCRAVLFLLLFLLLPPAYYLSWGNPPIPLSTYFIFAAMVLAWTLSVRTRIVDPPLRRFLTAMGVLMVSWCLIQIAKYDLLPAPESLNRFLWYLYYIPMLMMPLLSFWAALGLSRNSLHHWKWLLLPGLLLTAGILTNDYHQLTFRFHPGFTNWETDYSYGILYLCAVTWIAVLMIGSLVLVVHNSARSVSRRLLWVPLLAPAFGVVYLLLYPRLSTLWRTYQLTQIFIFMIAGMWEGCILIGLIPSNEGYEAFFRHSHLAAKLTDRSGTVIYAAGSAGQRPEDSVIHTHPVTGGQFEWIEDISHLNRLRQALAETNQRLSEESDLLRAENEIRREQAQIKAQTRIYDTLAAQVAPTAEKLSELVEQARRDPAGRENTMLWACVLAASIKRRANLTLLASRSPAVSLGELMMSISESADYLSRCGVSCMLSGGSEDPIPSGSALSAYALFETLLEAAMPELAGMIVAADSGRGTITLHLTMEPPFPCPSVRADGFSFTWTEEEDAVFGVLTWKKGGDPL